MIQADQRSCFRHAIPLNYGVAHALEETLGVIRERGAAGNEGPEFPAKAAMNPAEHPGAAKEFSPVGPFECAVQPRRLTVAFQIAFQPRFQQVQHAWHSDERRGAFALHRSNDLRRVR